MTGDMPTVHSDRVYSLSTKQNVIKFVFAYFYVFSWRM